MEIFAGLTIKDGLDPQVGIVGTSMEQMIARIGFSHGLGIRMFQITLPCWGALDERESMLHFKTVCGSFPDSQFPHYNLPRARQIIRGPEYHQIAQEVPNLVATKNSLTDYARTADLLVHSPELHHFLLEGNFAMGCTVSECSLLNGFEVLFPRTTWDFFSAGLKKDFDELFRIAKLLRDAGEAIFSHCTRDMIDGSFDKTFIWLRFPEFSNRLLPPYIGHSEEESRICRQVDKEKFSHVP